MRCNAMEKVAALILLVATGAVAGFAQNDADTSWISLFDGESLQGWEESKNSSSFTVEDGSIVAHGERSHLFYARQTAFTNFHFKADVWTSPGANSGIYFHTAYQEEGWPSKGYEAQVNNTYEGDPRRTGSLYGISDVLDAPATDNEWFTEHIIVEGKRITIQINEHIVVQFVEKEPVGERRLNSGTFALQAHDPGSRVLYRNILVRRLPDK